MPRTRLGQFLSRLRRRDHRKRSTETRYTVSQKLIDAHEEERRWLARELHDDIAEKLRLIHLSLGDLKDGNTSLVDFRRGVENVMDQVSNLSVDLQRLAHRLHASKLDLLGLAASAARFCAEVGEEHGVEIELRAEHIPHELPADISVSVFRVLQEAVQNAVTHSGSPRCEVTLAHDSNEIHLTVRDFGRGFDATAAITGRGLGLTGIRERVALVGGTLSIASEPQKGTTISARVPLRSTRAPARNA